MWKSSHRVRFGLGLLIASFAVMLAGCGGGSTEASSDAATSAEEVVATTQAPATDSAETAAEGEGAASASETLRIALDFTPNTNHSGIYVALAKGYFEEQGINAEVIPYSGTPAGVLVENGQADLAVAYPASTLIELASGSMQKIVAEIIQVNNAALVVPADSPAESPADLAGKVYGGYGTSHEGPIVREVLIGAGAENPEFKEVVLQTGAIEALMSGQVDFSSVYEGWSEIGAELAGTPLKTFRYGDYVEGYTYPDVVFVASDKAIETKGDLLKRGLTALSEGYAFAAENPAETATILTDQVPELAQSQELVSRSAEFRAPQYLDASGNWGCLTEGQFTGLIGVLSNAGVLSETPSFEDFATNDLLEACA